MKIVMWMGVVIGGIVVCMGLIMVGIALKTRSNRRALERLHRQRSLRATALVPATQAPVPPVLPPAVPAYTLDPNKTYDFEQQVDFSMVDLDDIPDPDPIAPSIAPLAPTTVPTTTAATATTIPKPKAPPLPTAATINPTLREFDNHISSSSSSFSSSSSSYYSSSRSTPHPAPPPVPHSTPPTTTHTINLDVDNDDSWGSYSYI